MSGEYPANAEYNKLVRDKIPEIIESNGLVAETRFLSEEEIVRLLKEKSVEEAKELADAEDDEEVKKEMADLLEILHSLSERIGVTMSEIEEIRQKRAEKRGRFQSGIFLERTHE